MAGLTAGSWVCCWQKGGCPARVGSPVRAGARLPSGATKQPAVTVLSVVASLHVCTSGKKKKSNKADAAVWLLGRKRGVSPQSLVLFSSTCLHLAALANQPH